MNILTFDVEEWYLEKILHGGRTFRYQQFDETFCKVLDELDKHGIKATFFCLQANRPFCKGRSIQRNENMII